jgi:hypothetical protein
MAMSGSGVEDTSTHNDAKRVSFVRTWPGKIAAVAATAIIGSAVSYFIGADFWEGLLRRVGLAAEPLSVQVSSDVDQFDSAGEPLRPEFIVPRPIAAIGPPPSGDRPEGRYGWAHKLGGVDTSTVIRVTVTGKSSSSVVLQDLEFKVTSRRPPLGGSRITYSSIKLGRREPVRLVRVDLDASPPKWSFEDKRGARFPFTVTNSEVEVFDIAADTAECDCSWTAGLRYVADGEQGITTIDDNGKPFRTTSFHAGPGQTGDNNGAPLKSYYWNRGGWRVAGLP